MIPTGEHVWIFSGDRSRLPSAVFATQAQAERWIEENRVTGTLTVYPVHVSAYEWAVSVGVLRPTAPRQQSPEFIANFTSPSQHRFRFENGVASVSQVRRLGGRVPVRRGRGGAPAKALRPTENPDRTSPWPPSSTSSPGVGLSTS